MSIVVSDQAEANLLNALLGITSNLSTVYFRLFTNNITVTESTVLTDFLELSSGLYTPLSVASGDWTVGTASGITTASRALYTWPISDSCNLYGYFVTDAANTLLYWAENFGSTISIPTGGASINFTARVSLD